MDILKIIEYWLKGAKQDQLAFQHLYENKDYPQCLFWGHFVLEKILKALVVNKTKQQTPYAHDLVLLATKAKIELTTEKRDQLNEINIFNQFGRYDNEIKDFTQKCTPEYTEKYFLIIKNLATWLMELFHQ